MTNSDREALVMLHMGSGLERADEDLWHREIEEATDRALSSTELAVAYAIALTAAGNAYRRAGDQLLAAQIVGSAFANVRTKPCPSKPRLEAEASSSLERDCGSRVNLRT